MAANCDEPMLTTRAFRVESEALRRLQEIARKEDRSLSSLVRRFLREGLERYSQNCQEAA
jgi:predicted transcriptional regulator